MLLSATGAVGTIFALKRKNTMSERVRVHVVCQRQERAERTGCGGPFSNLPAYLENREKTVFLLAFLERIAK